jgi:hypothetical protein
LRFAARRRRRCLAVAKAQQVQTLVDPARQIQVLLNIESQQCADSCPSIPHSADSYVAAFLCAYVYAMCMHLNTDIAAISCRFVPVDSSCGRSICGCVATCSWMWMRVYMFMLRRMHLYISATEHNPKKNVALQLVEDVKRKLESMHPDLPVGKNGRDDEELLHWFLKDRRYDVDAAIAKLVKALVSQIDKS